MEKHWLKSYPAGIPAEIDVTKYQSLAHMLEEPLSQYAERDAYLQMGKALTYRKLGEYSAAFGA